MTLYLLKVHLQTFLFIPITQKCQISSCEILVANDRYVFVADKVALGQDFLRLLLFSSVSIIPPVFHAHLSSTCYSYYEDKRSKPVCPLKRDAVTDFYVFNMGFSQITSFFPGRYHFFSDLCSIDKLLLQACW
jgi:hypothetical protein